MAQTIKLRRSSTAGSVPTTAQLALGEVAINTADGKLFIKKDVSGTESIVEIGAGAAVASSPVKFDDISGSFNGSDTTFNITVSSSAYTPGDVLTTIVSLNGVTQEPSTSYTISGSQITFTDPPGSNDEFYGIDLSTIISQTFGAGTEASPSITFVGDTDTGIYKPAADTLGFCMSGDEKLRIDSSGNVGIGTTSPSHELDVVGTTDPSIRVRATGTAAGDDALIRLSIAGTSASNYILFGDADDSDVGSIRYNHNNNSLNFNTNASTAVIIDSSGNVGIGTTSPDVLFEVQSSGSSAETVAEFGNSLISGGLQILTNGNLDWGFNARNSRNLTFSTNQLERARIDSSGRLLVGTSTATSPVGFAPILQLEGLNSTTTNLAITRSGANSSGGSITLSNNRSTTLGGNAAVVNNDVLGQIVFNGANGTNRNNYSARIFSRAEGTFTTSSAPGNLILETCSAGNIVPTERMRIDSSGNVGIGTTAPSSTLQVVGQIRAGSDPSTSNSLVSIYHTADGGQIEAIAANDYTSKKSLGLNAFGGNVGIGTASPSSILHLQNDDVLAIQIQRTGTFPSLCEIANEGNLLNIEQNVSGIRFLTGTTPTEKVRIDSSGNVGIGTSSPDEKLHIAAGASSSIRLGQAGGDFAYRLRANVSSSVNGGFLIEDAVSQNDLYRTISGSSGRHSFFIDGSEKVRIGSAGQIGIGGANYGTSGQVLTSQGANAAPQWADAGGSGGFDAGTAMLFQQTAAPTGWTKSTTHNNKALRVVSGTAGSGGSSNFDSVFGSSISTNAHTLTTTQIPSHTHSSNFKGNNFGGPYGFHTWNAQWTTNNGTTTTITGSGSQTWYNNTATITGGATGGGGSHSHTMSMNIAYVDTIIATKD